MTNYNVYGVFLGAFTKSKLLSINFMGVENKNYGQDLAGSIFVGTYVNFQKESHAWNLKDQTDGTIGYI